MVLQRANDFLLTNDTDVLLATLRLCIRPAQQWSTQHLEVATGFGISHARLLDLAQSWSLASDPSAIPSSFLDVLLADTAIKAATQEVTFQFYRKADSTPPKSADAPATVDKGKRREEPDGSSAPSSAPQSSAPASTPIPKGRSKDKDKTPGQTPGSVPAAGTSNAVEGLTTIRVPPRQLNATDRAQDVLADLVEEHAIPAEHRLRLFQRIRLAMAMRDPKAKSQMAVVRLLSLALYLHTTDESTATSKIFIFEPNLVAQLAELVHPDKGVAREVQAAAFYALEAAGRYRGRISEVTSAVGVSVSHGVLMQVVRKLARDLVQPDTGLSLEYIDSVFCFLSCLQQSAYAGALLVGAGIVPVLVDLCKTAHVDHINVVTRAVTSLDGLMFGFQTAFPLFTQAEGMKVFVGRIKEQVELAVVTHSASGSSPMKPSELLTGLLSHPAAGLLKALLRAIQRLLSSAGTMDSVRNLTETPLPTAIKLIMRHKAIFGYQIYSLAINQMSTIIHSEPTSLAILQEAELPETFYDAVEAGIEPAFDVIAAIPAALGALCLNEAGLTQLNQRGAIESLFAIFASDKHAKVLRERDCASVLGGSLDELVRHQPTLKPKILEHSVALVKRLAEVGKDWQPPEEWRSYYWLKPERAEGESEEVEMKDDAAAATASKDKGKAPETAASEVPPSAEKDKPHADNAPLLMLDVTCRVRSALLLGPLAVTDLSHQFLEAMLQNVATCQDFFLNEGASTLLDILHMPFIPYDFGVPPTVDAFSSLIRVLSEAMPKDTLVAVMAQLHKSMEQSAAFWKPMDKGSDEGQFLKMVRLTRQ